MSPQCIITGHLLSTVFASHPKFGVTTHSPQSYLESQSVISLLLVLLVFILAIFLHSWVPPSVISSTSDVLILSLFTPPTLSAREGSFFLVRDFYLICSNSSQKRVHQHHVEILLEGKSSPHDVGALCGEDLPSHGSCRDELTEMFHISLDLYVSLFPGVSQVSSCRKLLKLKLKT